MGTHILRTLSKNEVLYLEHSTATEEDKAFIQRSSILCTRILIQDSKLPRRDLRSRHGACARRTRLSTVASKVSTQSRQNV